MTQIEKARLLKLLYQHRAMGFEYFKEYKSFNSTNKLVPQNFDSLEKSISNCHMCNLSKTRKNIVFGEGNQNAKVMFIGESPKADDSSDIFVGRAGDILTNIIEKVLCLKREDVYIANIIKCKTPENRVPSLEEASACKPYLVQQISMVNPDIIVTLGSTSFHHLIEEFDRELSKVRGEVLDFGKAKLIPTFCPYFLLRNPSAKKEVFLDMLKVKGLL